MTQIVTIESRYLPRHHQVILHKNLKRFNVIVCHRRFGKSIFAINHAIHSGLKNRLEAPQYAYVAPFISQAKKVAWDYFKKYTSDFPTAKPHETELRIDIHRASPLDVSRPDYIRFFLVGADNAESLRGIYLDGVILDEYDQMDPSVWSEILRPALSDRLGWAMFIGTFKGIKNLYPLYEKAKSDPNWYTAKFKASETKIIPKEELELAKATMSEETYLQEFQCEVSTALAGYYYTNYIQKLEEQNRITVVPYDPYIPVETYWDLGISDTTSIWFLQRIGKEFHLIDYLESSGVGLEWYVREIRNKPYTYAEYHNLPHDAAARELGSGKTRQETLRALGLRSRIGKKQTVADGINAVRTVLPHCWFDKDKCKKGIESLKNYRRKWDDKNKIFQDLPLHDLHSHAADSFRYLALGSRQESKDKQLPSFAEKDYNYFGG